MRTSSVVLLIVVIVIIVGGAYYLLTMQPNTGVSLNNGTPSATPGVPNTGGPGANSSGNAAVAYVIMTSTSSANPSLGTFLVATNGMTLYRYMRDASNTSNCTGSCAAIWIPYTIASSTPLAASPDAAGQVGTLTRADGSLQVTYNGKPLYFWHNDVNPGDTRGQGIASVWTVVHP